LVVKKNRLWWVLPIFFGLLTGTTAFAQRELTQRDSVTTLSAVTVRATLPERFLAGQKIQRIDSTTLLQFRFGSLTDLLQFNTPLAFKNYGPGQLATVSFRGTSANHTAVLWNDIDINQPNLGQTDFSTLPVAGFDRLSVQYGSSASVVGSGAVGGSVLLGSAGEWRTGIGVSLGQQVSSFRNNQTQLGVRYGGSLGKSWQLSGKSFAYRSQFNNDYPYRERRNYFVEQSQTAQRGLVQDIFLRDKRGRQVSVNAWLTDNDLVLTPQDTVAREQTRTQSARLLASYEANAITLRLGWIQDRFDYAKGNFDLPSRTRTDRFLARAEREFTFWPGNSQVQTVLRVGGEWSHYRTVTDGYGGQLITENRQNLYALLRVQTPRWLVSANIRQAYVTRFNPPLTPSLGVEHKLIRREKLALTANASIGRSYRVPTLNERYWQVLGNPNLRSENGLNMEAGLTATANLTDNFALTTDATAYRNRVDDWSYWNPDFGYRVENLQLVVAQGGELNTTLTYARDGWQAGIRAGYALTRSSQQRVYNVYAQDIVGKQLPYVPIHNGTLNAWIARNKTRLTVQTQASSRRYITFDESQYFKGIVLTNVLLETDVHVGSVPVRVQGQINNVFDTLLFSVKRNALPGRNFSINLLINSPLIKP